MRDKEYNKFRVFLGREGKRGYRKIVRAYDLEVNARRVAFSGGLNPAGPILSYTNNKDKISLCLYNIVPRNFSGNTCTTTDIVSWVSYNKKTKKYTEHHPTNLFLILANRLPKGVYRAFNLEWFWEREASLIGVMSKRERKKFILGGYTNLTKLTKDILASRGLSWVGHYKHWSKHLSKPQLHILTGLEPTSQIHPKDLQKNLDHPVDYSLVQDTIRMLKILGRKGSIKWGERRWKQEHDKVSNEILSIKRLTMKDRSLGYPPAPLDPKIRLLSSSLDFYEEGESMKHCVFSANYFEKALRGECYLFSYKDGGDTRVTVEASIDDKGGINIKQVRGRYNHLPTNLKEIESYIQSTLSKKAWVTFFKDAQKGRGVKESPIHIAVDRW